MLAEGGEQCWHCQCPIRAVVAAVTLALLLLVRSATGWQGRRNPLRGTHLAILLPLLVLRLLLVVLVVVLVLLLARLLLTTVAAVHIFVLTGTASSSTRAARLLSRRPQRVAVVLLALLPLLPPLLLLPICFLLLQQLTMDRGRLLLCPARDLNHAASRSLLLTWLLMWLVARVALVGKCP